MHKEEQEIRRLAQLYFEGKITLQDEPALYAFISEKKQNTILFKQWEREWMQQVKTDLSVHREWLRLQNRINLLKKNRFSYWSQIAAAAVIALLMTTTALGFYENSRLNRNELFTVETPMGEKSKVLLPDGSTVWLNAGSRISYGNHFNRRNREVTISGEAYFEVAQQTQHPFTVKTKEYDVEVKGTEFNVSSYDNEQFSTTTLMEGSIVLRHFNKEYLLKPGEQMQVDVETHRLYLHSANAQQYKSWTEGRIEYDSISLSELFNRIAREYNLQVHIDKDVNTSLILNVSLNNQETPGEILYGLSKITPFKFRYNKTDIYISK